MKYLVSISTWISFKHRKSARFFTRLVLLVECCLDLVEVLGKRAHFGSRLLAAAALSLANKRFLRLHVLFDQIVGLHNLSARFFDFVQPMRLLLFVVGATLDYNLRLSPKQSYHVFRTSGSGWSRW